MTNTLCSVITPSCRKRTRSRSAVFTVGVLRKGVGVQRSDGFHDGLLGGDGGSDAPAEHLLGCIAVGWVQRIDEGDGDLVILGADGQELVCGVPVQGGRSKKFSVDGSRVGGYGLESQLCGQDLGDFFGPEQIRLDQHFSESPGFAAAFLDAERLRKLLFLEISELHQQIAQPQGRLVGAQSLLNLGLRDITEFPDDAEEGAGRGKLGLHAPCIAQLVRLEEL